MVYYGVLSRGCQRCRKRKVKCDEQKPGCLRCHKADVPCPGYRNLDDIRFRDESRRITTKARHLESQQRNRTQSQHFSSAEAGRTQLCGPAAQWFTRYTIPKTISIPHHDLSPSFFFSKYAFHEVPFSEAYRNWLTGSYRDSSVLKAAIDAVGLAGMSNVSYAPHLETRARRRYWEALAATQQNLSNATDATDDRTLMAVILLGLFEARTLSFRNGDQYRCWETHIKGALALLELRGQEQFTRERGGQLYTQIRSQILSVYMQQNSGVPAALVQTARSFQSSRTRQRWRQGHIATPSSIFEISFRIVNLRARMLRGEEGLNRQAVRKAALDVDEELQRWRAALPAEWNFEVHVPAAPLENAFGEKRHIYPSLWNAEVWNNWRLVRLLVSRVLLDTGPGTDDDESIEQPTGGTLSLIRPLCVVALEEPNLASVRTFAVDRLRRIGASMGVRQAVLLADAIAGNLSEARSGQPMRPSSCWDVPMMPFC
ncbi:fungal specific transcription factor domain-containing protein [Purpureocillium lavendulum]|uniref:Fungal specific transcription factor domain-containing protein n=1 Tax=Purpureocillium lavendulum TaxID=1247861 RepID=A0AB34G7B6_9HYPO|nr:fungal specific transcription factor domain-containing protein [Purpureocillium lavendulum]